MKTIEELKTFLLASFPQERIYLFGSRARGNNPTNQKEIFATI